MKCECIRCRGTGEVTCQECDGTGQVDNDILEEAIEMAILKVDRKDPLYEELIEFQHDAIRVRKQAEQLCKLKPHRSKSYTDQLWSALVTIESQVVKAIRDAEMGKKRKRIAKPPDAEERKTV